MFAALGVEYQRLPIPPELFAETVRALGAAGFAGANVTIPHKEEALTIADTATERARAIGAANTLTFDGARIAADNTDAPGFLAALPEPPEGRSALVLGAGGSARAVVWALRQAGAADVRIWNRTAERAQKLAAELGGRAVESAEPADLLVNCTSIGLGDASESEIPIFKNTPVTADNLGEFATVVDLVYRPGGTELLHAASERGTAVVDGLEILVQQGALSYEAWIGNAPDQALMREAAYQADAPPSRSNQQR